MQRPSLLPFTPKQYHTVLQLDRDLLKTIQLNKLMLQKLMIHQNGCIASRLSTSIKYLLGLGLTLETD